MPAVMSVSQKREIVDELTMPLAAVPRYYLWQVSVPDQKNAAAFLWAMKVVQVQTLTTGTNHKGLPPLPIELLRLVLEQFPKVLLICNHTIRFASPAFPLRK
jgi:hypothetical protein